jgi:stringent starvation protein B
MDAPTGKLPPKKEVLDSFLENGSARIFIDPRRAGAIVPQWFSKQPELVLRVGYTLSPPIPDLKVAEEAVSATLSFNRAPFFCKMPWSVIFAIVSDVSGRGVVWPEDVPIESQLLKPQRPSPVQAVRSRDSSPEAPRVPASLGPKKVQDPPDPASGASSTDGDAGDKPKRKLPPYLRVVK